MSVDRARCVGHGVCAALLEQVDLDEFGYPLQSRVAGERRDLRTAVAWCPARALYPS